MGQISWYCGPDRHAVFVDETGMARTAASDLFHGIVSDERVASSGLREGSEQMRALRKSCLGSP